MEKTDNPFKRCTNVGQHGQCKHEAVEGLDKCPHHGGLSAQKSLNTKAVSSYRLNVFQARLNQHATDPEIKSLRGEIGLLRMLIENRVNNCKDDYDLMLQSSAIASLIVDANTLVSSCHRIETLTGQLLDKQSLAEFAAQVVSIISDECDNETSDRIAEKILLCLAI